MEKGQGLLAMDDDGKSDPYVEVNVFDIKKVTTYIKETLNPTWNQDLLFIIPFEQMEAFQNHQSIAASNNETEPTFMYGDGGKSGAGKSFAAIDVNGSVVHGLDLPEYCKAAIIEENTKKYGHEFHYETADSAASLNKTIIDSPALERRATSQAMGLFANAGSQMAGGRTGVEYLESEIQSVRSRSQ